MKFVRLIAKNYLYTFYGSDYSRRPLGDSHMDPGYPKSIASGWGLGGDFDAGIDAAFQVGDKCYFVKGDRMIRRIRREATGAGDADPSFSRALASFDWGGFGASCIDAIVAYGSKCEGFVFKGDECIEISMSNGEPGKRQFGPMKITDKFSLPTYLPRVTAALVINGLLHLFTTDETVFTVSNDDSGLFLYKDGPLCSMYDSVLGPPVPSLDYWDRSSWMAHVPDATWLYTLDIPGTHDSVAINAWFRTPYATQDHSITRQLEQGIRLLDIRLRVRQVAGVAGARETVLDTCHGKVQVYDSHIYQTFASVANECRTFLAQKGTEIVIMSIKVDDWNGLDSKAARNAVVTCIKDLLGDRLYRGDIAAPSVQGCRGTIFVLDRILASTPIGLQLDIPANHNGYLPVVAGGPDLYVQDVFSGLASPPVESKLSLVIDAARVVSTRAESSRILLMNFASATQYVVLGVYINRELIRKVADLIQKKQQPARLGWMLFDYAFSALRVRTSYQTIDAVDLLIAYNDKVLLQDKFKALTFAPEEFKEDL